MKFDFMIISQKLLHLIYIDYNNNKNRFTCCIAIFESKENYFLEWENIYFMVCIIFKCFILYTLSGLR